MDSKRLKSSHTAYPYPAVNDADQDLERRPEAEKREWEYRLIERTNSMEWGTGERATLQAGLEPMVTRDNERLLRTHHRSLLRASVSILAQTLVDGQINPKKFLTAQDLDFLRILITGLEQTRNLGCPNTATFSVTAQKIDSGAFVSDREARSVGRLGLKWKLIEGKMVLTTVTHAYVRNLALPAVFMRVADWVIRAKNALYRVLYPHWDQDSRTNDLSGQSQSNNPRGKDILLFKTNIKLFLSGRSPTASTTQAYTPVLGRYRHDLSLIEGETLPDVKVLAGAPLYTVALNAQTERWRVIEGANVTPALASSVLLGSEYIWNCEASNQAVAILWRSKDKVDRGEVSPSGLEIRPLVSLGVSQPQRLIVYTEGHMIFPYHSGAVLCTGVPTDQHGEAVIFQNYETGLRMWESEGSSLFAKIKAGFLLPGEIRESKTVDFSPQQPINYNTVAKRVPCKLKDDRHKVFDLFRNHHYQELLNLLPSHG
ncbi:uncharacterized protein BDW70DRAFT_154275 [Aspergillus foveolatus]|uniref:uncharacterized protein n=1 Tax=Aspergillus foveolatus TaxID=210207 RepID=UPI003CCDCC0F